MLIDHGTFTAYSPARPVEPDPETNPPQTWTAAERLLAERIDAKGLFLRNGAGLDWYAGIADMGPTGRVFAVLREDTVISVSDDPSTLFPVDCRLVETDAAAQPGWRFVDGALADPATIPPSIDDLRAYAAERRWARETGGITVGGIAVPTDDRAKVLLMSAAGTMADGDTAPFVSGSTSAMLTGAQFKALYAALVAHTQDCFARQTAALAAIEAGTATTRTQIDAYY